MRIDVAFLPTLLRRSERSVCVVIDVLRATSTLVTLAAGGAADVTVVAGIDEAFALRDQAPESAVPILCGEVGGLPPEGFDFGNSPAEFARLNLAGRRVVLSTSNGTKALVQAAHAPTVFVGALLNLNAVTRAAVQAANERMLDLCFVCSGTDLGTSYCLEDGFCAGALVAKCLPGCSPDTVLGDGAQTAMRLFASFPGGATEAFAAAEHGRKLANIGLAADLDFCAQQDRYAVVPRVERQDGRVVVTAA